MKLYNTVKELCLCPSISGREQKICELLAKRVAPFCDEVRTDTLGNLIALKKGSSKDAKKIMLAAHMDEIGFLATFIEDSGMIRVANVGGISFVASSFSKVVSENGVKGVLVPDSKTKAADFKSDVFYIDIGAKNKKQTEAKVKIGDFFVAAPSLEKLMGNRIAGRPLDDRIGCAILLGIAEKIAEVGSDHDVYYVFSVQEEVGCRGALPAAFSIAPDYALCFDVTGTGDTPAATPMACSLGGGAAIKIKDASVICNEGVVKKLTELAKANGIKHQKEILLYGGTDTSAMQLAGSGAAAGALSIPSRYIHSGVEVCDLDDVQCCIDLAVAFIRDDLSNI